MKKSRLALALTAAAFSGWLVYLATQAWSYRRPPIVVSRSQLLASELEVVADLVSDGEGKPAVNIRVARVLFSSDPTMSPKLGDELKIQNLASATGYGGPGTYVVPVVRRGGLLFVALPPLDPGVPSFRSSDPVIYPATDAVVRQVETLRGAR